MVAVKSEPRQKSYQELTKLGVGTFRIDEETAKGMVSGRFTKKIKIKRCGRCRGCKTQNCRICNACKAMKKYGGPGVLKQACIHRKCENPTNIGQPIDLKKSMVQPTILKDVSQPIINKEFKKFSYRGVPYKIVEYKPQTEENSVDNGENTFEVIKKENSKTKVSFKKEITEFTMEVSDDDDYNPLNQTAPDLPRIPIPPRSKDKPSLSYGKVFKMFICIELIISDYD